MGNKRSQIWKISEEEFRKIISNSCSYRDATKKLSCNTGGNPYLIVQKRIKELSISVNHFDRYIKKRRPAEEVFIENSNYSRNSLILRLIRLNLIPHGKCAICKIGRTWNDKKLSLQIDHINGTKDDNRLENLRFLCPNCHSQTDTFAGRNKEFSVKSTNHCIDCGVSILKRSKRCTTCVGKIRHKINWPPVDELIIMVHETSYVAVGKKLGVSDSAVRKHIKQRIA